MLILIIILLIIFAIVPIGIYNALVSRKNQTENAFGAIDAMLKKRYDLIPNMVEAVKQYIRHENDTFTRLTALRTALYSQMNADDKVQFDRDFSSLSRQFMVTVENYPQLRASENFMQLQRTLNETEEQLAASRRTYNACVTAYNNSVETFPGNLIAGMFGFFRKPVLTIPEEEKKNPGLKDLFKS